MRTISTKASIQRSLLLSTTLLISTLNLNPSYLQLAFLNGIFYAKFNR